MINHCASVQLRVNGSGTLDLRLLSLDGERTRVLPSITMAASTSKLPVAITNFTTPRMRLELTTTEIDETFVIGKIILFLKPIFTSYPQ